VCSSDLADLYIDENDMAALLGSGQARRAAPATRGTAELKARGGLVRAEVVLDRGVISCVRLTGDFHLFPVEAIEAVERSVVGLVPEMGALEAALFINYKKGNIESPGMSVNDLARVIVEAAAAAARSNGDKVL
jgi:hypothetical protein